MKATGVSQADIVEKTDLTKTAVSLLANDRQDYSPTIIRDVALALNISAFELLMHPADAMALRQLRRDAMQVVKTSEILDRSEDRNGTSG